MKSSKLCVISALYGSVSQIVFTNTFQEYTIAGLNKYEKMSEGFAAYAARMPDRDTSDAVNLCKNGFDNISKIYRTFCAVVTDQLCTKMVYWLGNDHKALSEVARQLEKTRVEYDNAFDKYRRFPTDPEAESRKNAAEAAHEAQIAATKTSLAALDDYVGILKIDYGDLKCYFSTT